MTMTADEEKRTLADLLDYVSDSLDREYVDDDELSQACVESVLGPARYWPLTDNIYSKLLYGWRLSRSQFPDENTRNSNNYAKSYHIDIYRTVSGQYVMVSLDRSRDEAHWYGDVPFANGEALNEFVFDVGNEWERWEKDHILKAYTDSIKAWPFTSNENGTLEVLT